MKVARSTFQIQALDTCHPFLLGIPEVEEVGLTRISMEMIKPSPPEEEPNHIIDAGYKFAKKRFDQEFRWELSAELEATIFKAIFG
jgi:hypothetical protein